MQINKTPGTKRGRVFLVPEEGPVDSSLNIEYPGSQTQLYFRVESYGFARML